MAAPSCDPDIAGDSCLRSMGTRGMKVSGKEREHLLSVGKVQKQIMMLWPELPARCKEAPSKSLLLHTANRWCRQPEQPWCQPPQGSLHQPACAARPWDLVRSLVTSRGEQLCLPCVQRDQPGLDLEAERWREVMAAGPGSAGESSFTALFWAG